MCLDGCVPRDFVGYVEYVKERNITSGYGDGTFRLFNNVRRDEVSKFLAVGFALPVQAD